MQSRNLVRANARDHDRKVTVPAALHWTVVHYHTTCSVLLLCSAGQDCTALPVQLLQYTELQ